MAACVGTSCTSKPTTPEHFVVIVVMPCNMQAASGYREALVTVWRLVSSVVGVAEMHGLFPLPLGSGPWMVGASSLLRRVAIAHMHKVCRPVSCVGMHGHTPRYNATIMLATMVLGKHGRGFQHVNALFTPSCARKKGYQCLVP